MNFHNKFKKLIVRCKTCHKGRTKSKIKAECICARCTQDKKITEQFSKENNIIPLSVLNVLQNLTQYIEMLICRDFPVMQEFTRPRLGIYNYKSHKITT